MIEYKYADLFAQDTVDKQVLIEYDGGVITNTELFSESMELTETLCSESELRFGACEASVIKFKIGNMLTSLIGKWITVKMYLNGNVSEPFQIGKYKVYSDKPTADRKWRDIVAYDALYDIINTNVADWYNTILPNENSTVTMKVFRTGFLSHFGIEQEETDLVNDSMVVAKTIQPDAISGKDVITAICEINGCFGHITRDGKFKYVYLDRGIQGVFPRNGLYPADDLFPMEPYTSNVGVNGGYISAKYEDFSVKSIEKLQIRKEENDIGVIVGEDNAQNAYIIEDNFLVYGKSTSELREIANKIYGNIRLIIYKPYNATLRGNPCFEVGDAIRFITRYDLIESYVFQRTLKGIQALRDNFSAKGVETYGQKVNSLHKSIIELKGKSNVLERTIEETKSTITDVEKGLQSQITQTADSIKTEVSKTYSTKSDATNKANMAEANAKADTAEKLESYSTTTEMNSAITQSANSITSTVNQKITETKTYAQTQASTAEANAKADTAEKLESYSTTTEMNSAITQSANSITSTVNQKITETKTYADGKVETLNTELSSKITQNSDKIALKVSKGDVSSEISQESGQVKITAGRFIVESDYLDINKDGTSGEIVSKNSSGRYIKFNTGGLEGGYNSTAKCKIQCSSSGLAFRGASMTFCMDSIYVGTSMNTTKTNKAYTGDIAYVAPVDGDVEFLNAAVLHVWNGLVLDNATYD
jgi:hypothetical protein